MSTKYEYANVYHSWHSNAIDIFEDFLADWAKQGWKLVSVRDKEISGEYTRCRALYKRPLQLEPTP